MRHSSNAAICLVALLSAFAAEPVQAAGARPVSAYSLDSLNSWADAIAVCAVTRFLLADPDLTADVIVVKGETLYAPLYIPPTNFFSRAMRETYIKLLKTGAVSERSVGQARIRYAQLMQDSYRHASTDDKKFLLDQMDTCYRVAKHAGVKLNFTKNLAD